MQRDTQMLDVRDLAMQRAVGEGSEAVGTGTCVYIVTISRCLLTPIISRYDRLSCGWIGWAV